jgi:hypothetical protein
MKRTGRAVRANLRIWWPELIVTTLCAFFILVGVFGSASQSTAMYTFGGYTGFAAGIGWALGFRHRHMPVFEVIRRMGDGQRRMEDKLDQALAGEDKPAARVRHLRGL